MYVWAIVLLITTIVAAALWEWKDVCWLLWLALAAFVLAKAIRILEVAFFMKETGVFSRIYLLIINLALGGGALYVLVNVLAERLGFLP